MRINSIAVILIIIATSFSGCIGETSNILENNCIQKAKKGIALSFDDSNNINYWDLNREYFIENNLTATFFIDHFSTLSENEKNILYNLQNEGHEIGLHTANHSDYFIYEGSSQSYYEEEVLSSKLLMEEFGYNIESFAYPHGHRNVEIDNLLLQEISVLRGTRANENNSQPWLTDCEDGGVFRAISVSDSQNNIEKIIENLTIVSTSEMTILLYSHGINSTGDGISFTNLTLIVDEALRLNIPWLKMSDLGKD